MYNSCKLPCTARAGAVAGTFVEWLHGRAFCSSCIDLAAKESMVNQHYQERARHRDHASVVSDTLNVIETIVLLMITLHGICSGGSCPAVSRTEVCMSPLQGDCQTSTTMDSKHVMTDEACHDRPIG